MTDGIVSATVFVAGQGEVDFHERGQLREVYKVIREEDPDDKLMLGQHPQTREWVLFLKPRANPFGLDAPYPVLGLGTETPDPSKVRELLHKTDTRRNGDQILKDIHANNDRLRMEMDKKASEGTEIMAEARASYLHRKGDAPYHQSLAKRDPIHRQYSTRKD